MPIEVGSASEPNYDYGYVELVTLVNEARMAAILPVILTLATIWLTLM